MTLLAFLACSSPAPKDSAGGDSGDSSSDTAGDTGTDTGTDTGKVVELVLYSSGGGGGAATPFKGEYVEEECPTVCDPNTPPALDDPILYVNGYPSASVTVGDHVAVAIAYSDAECNLGCGAQYYSWESPRAAEADAGSLPSNLPCDTSSGGVWLGFDFGVVEAGSYSWSLHVEDACGGESERREGSFTVKD